MKQSEPPEPSFTLPPAASGRNDREYLLSSASAIAPISIVIPVFNTGPVFLETVAALRRQTFQASEWIIVDDGSSSSETVRMLEAVAEETPRATLIRHSQNKGLSAARNTGARHSKAPFVFLQDSDDLLEPTALEKFLWFLLAHPELGFVSSYEVGFGATQYLNRNGFHEGKRILTENRSCPLVLLRKELFTITKGFDESLREGLEDWDFWLRCAENGIWGGTVPEYLKWYRRSPAQAGRWKDWDEGERQAQFTARLIEKYPRIYSGAFPEPAWKEAPLAFTPSNPLKLTGAVLIVVERAASLDEPTLAEIERALHGRHLSVVILGEGHQASEQRLLKLTSDLFVLPRIVPASFFGDFLAYLGRSRKFQKILLSASRAVLPFRLPLADACGGNCINIVTAGSSPAALAALI